MAISFLRLTMDFDKLFNNPAPFEWDAESRAAMKALKNMFDGFIEAGFGEKQALFLIAMMAKGYDVDFDGPDSPGN